MTSQSEDGEPGNWRSQFANLESQYAELIPELSSPYSVPLSKNSEPLSNVSIPRLQKDDFGPSNAVDGLDSNVLEAQKKRLSIASSTQLFKVEELEAMFKVLVSTLGDIHDAVGEASRGNAGNRTSALAAAKNNLAQLCGNIDKFQFEKIDSVSTGELESGQALVRTKRKSLNKRCDSLRRVALETNAAVEQLMIEFQNNPVAARGTDPQSSLSGVHADGALSGSTEGTAAAIDGIVPDWSGVMSLQNKRVCLPICHKLVLHMERLKLPVSNQLYTFLQDPTEFAGCLIFDSYEFTTGELEAVLSFFADHSSKLRKKVIELVLVNCGLTDGDCYVLAKYLDCLVALEGLSLKSNDITGSGAERICSALAAMGPTCALRTLRFDHNHIDGYRLKRISSALIHCPMMGEVSFAHNPIGDVGLYFFLLSCLNPLRRAAQELPAPHELVSSQGLLSVEGGLDGRPDLDALEDIGTDEESEPKDRALDEGPAVDQKASDSFKLARRLSMQQKRLMRQRKSNKLLVGMRVRIESKWMELGKIGLGGGSLMEGADVNMSRARIQRVFKSLVLKLRSVGTFLRVPLRGVDMPSLYLEGCQLSPFSGHMLQMALADNTNITNLFLSDNHLGDNGVIALAELLSDSGSSIRVLELRANGLTENAVKRISQAASRSSSLTSLDISNNLIGPTAANWVAAATGTFFLDDFSLTSMDRSMKDRMFQQQRLAAPDNRGDDML